MGTAMFDGATFTTELDRDRLARQMERVRLLMRDAGWRTLYEIGAITGDPLQSISARLRDLRKQKFGGHTVHRRRVAETGTWEYQVILRG